VRKYQIFIGRREEQGEECKEGSASEEEKEGRSRLRIQECKECKGFRARIDHRQRW
jgi:hypothetical protein